MKKIIFVLLGLCIAGCVTQEDQKKDEMEVRNERIVVKEAMPVSPERILADVRIKILAKTEMKLQTAFDTGASGMKVPTRVILWAEVPLDYEGINTMIPVHLPKRQILEIPGQYIQSFKAIFPTSEHSTGIVHLLYIIR